ncbi:hypothetical protein chiPu_0028245, partial [Chiloscyllium punctatum]|nr:hypothetical protein [Chiloscyllium punctatum]
MNGDGESPQAVRVRWAAILGGSRGWSAVYRSWFSVISSLCCSNFVYFYTFNALKDAWVKGQASTNSKDLVMGFISG